MATINGTQNNDLLQGTDEDDTINGLNGQDRISGEGGDDTIDGGDGDDIIFGDAGEGTAPGVDADPLTLVSSNLVQNTPNGGSAQIGESVVYRDITTLEDGTAVSARLILLDKDNNFRVDMSGGTGAEILLNGNNDSSDAGKTASFRMEFFIPATPNGTTGTPVSINSVATFNDLDRNSNGSTESVSIDANSFSAFGVSDDTSLTVTNANGVVNAAGGEQNNPSDQDAWFSAQFEDRSFIEFTLEARSSASGFSMNGNLIDGAVVTPIEAGNDTIFGGAGQDTIFGQGGDDTIDGGSGDDVIDGGEGNDILEGGQGQDRIDGGEGNDVLSGGAGDDLLRGGAGEDTLTAGPDNDRLEGGQDSDLFTITAAGNHTIVGGEDADGLDVDVLDLSGFDVNIIRSGPESGRVEFLDSNGNVTRRLDYSEIEEIIPCFTPGTMIATPQGERRVEELREGDRVITRDNGIQEIRWVGQRSLEVEEVAENPDLSPILIKAGALGRGLPERDLIVSPQHRVLIANDKTQLFFEENEVLVAAKHLVGLEGVRRVGTVATTYVHFMFDAHEVVLSNGAWTESFQPGDYTLGAMGDEPREEILSLFPELQTEEGVAGYASARRSLKGYEARLLHS
ncbi:Hint domain-containing protein [Shimia ponticola]|uniref:Hint domain-containing protein n=1 Tax=Shimia ponticola TaxID=2582893 RepID=UPI0011BFDD24|nr:Hint domain-containing protein [Shimia ponticola]